TSWRATPPLRHALPLLPGRSPAAARATLAARGDALTAAHAGYLEIRRLLLIGSLDAAERMLDGLDPSPFPPALRVGHELVVAGRSEEHTSDLQSRVNIV